MTNRPPDNNPRRTVLKSLALTVAASYSGVGAARVAAAGESAALRPLRVGVLLPAATRSPELAERYLAGLKLALSVPGVQLVSRAVARPAELEAAARDLLTREGVQVLVALGDGLQTTLRALAEQHHTPLIVSELGGLMPRGESGSAFVFSNSLQLWQAQWALGAWSVRHLGRQVQVVTSLLESGYDLPYAFASGVEAAGGTVLHTSFADSFAGQPQSAQVLGRSRELQPDHVHFIASEAASLDFVAAYGRSLHHLHTPLTASGLALGEALRPVGGSRGVRTALTWAADLDSPTNRAFVQAYQRVSGRPADALAALGFETGGWIVQAQTAVQGQHAQTQAWLKAFAAARLHSPRGEITVDAQHRAQAPLYLRLSGIRGGQLVHTLAGQLAAPPAQHRALQALLEAPRTGWLATYLHA